MALFVSMLILVMLVALASPTDNCQANPLTGNKTPTSQNKTIDSIPAPSVFSELITKITILQMQLKQKIAAYVHDFNSSGTITPLLPLFILSLIYGAAHAAGPGHGKVIAMSYTLAHGKGYLSGLLLGGMIALIHASSAISLVFILRYVLEKAITSNLESVTQVTQVFSYGLISLIGLYLFGTSMYSFLKGIAGTGRSHSHQRHYATPFTAALAIGIIPCPGVLMILLFCLSLEQSVLGLLLCATVSLGMAMTISASVWISLTGKKLLLHLTGKTEQKLLLTEQILSCLAGLFLTILGAILLIAFL